LILLAAVVIIYQLAGGFVQSIITGSIQNSYSSIIIGIHGMIIQVFLGFVILITLKDYEFKNDR
jgi:uncharacterized membrane protein YjjP (DUF1212 family)